MHHEVSKMVEWRFGRNLAASPEAGRTDDLCGKSVDFRVIESLNGLGEGAEL